LIIEVKNLDQPLVCCAVTSVWPSEGSPMADHLDQTWMTYQKSQKLRLAHKTSTYWFELSEKSKTRTIRLQPITWIADQKSQKLGPAHKTSTYWLELLYRNVKNSDQPIRLQTYSLELLIRKIKNSDQP